MSDQQKILRVLRLISFLSDKPYRTLPEIASLLEISERTVYRYLILLQEIGYLIDKDERNAFFLFEADPRYASAFEPEEVQLLNQLISSIDQEHPLRQSLKKKIHLSSSLIPLSEELMDKHQAKIINRLNTAIEEKRQVRLLRYQSATSNTPRNRHIEPLSLVKVNSQLCAYDLESDSIKHFKVKRIEDIEILDISCRYNREAAPTDLFGFTSSEPTMVKLQLSKRAYRLLIEEFPETKPFTSQSDADTEKPFRFVCEVRSPIGIGRFILGLPGEISVESPKVLKDYLKGRIKEFQL